MAPLHPQQHTILGRKMARGWESKSVEAQIETADRGGQNNGGRRLTHAEMEIIRKREGLLLSRKRVLNDLQAARHPRHRSMLEEALRHLDRQLEALDNPGR